MHAPLFTLRRLTCVLLAGLTAPLILTGCFEQKIDRAGLGEAPGLTDTCYTGDPVTLNVGMCRQGFNINYADADGVIQSDCLGQVTPVPEVCDTLDNDCNGLADDGSACAAQQLTALEGLAGDLNVIDAQDRIGPAMVAKPDFGVMYECAGLEPAACAAAFMKANGPLYGLVGENQAMRPTETVMSNGVAVVHMQQTHYSVPVLESWATITVGDEGVQSVLARILPAPMPGQEVPEVSADEAEAMLPVGSQRVTPLGTVFQPRYEAGPASMPEVQRLRYDLVHRFEYADAEDDIRVIAFDARDGSTISDASQSDIALDVDVTHFDNETLVTEPYDDDEHDVAQQIAEDLFDFADYENLLEVDDGTIGSKKGKVYSSMPIKVGFEKRSCAKGSSGFHSAGAVHSCGTGSYSAGEIRDLWRHEMNHWLVKNSWNLGYKPDGDTYQAEYRQHNAMVDYFSQVGGEILECYQHTKFGRDGADCEFFHQTPGGLGLSGQDYQDEYTMSDLAGDTGSADGRYPDSRPLGHAMWKFYDEVSADESPEHGITLLVALYLSSFKQLPSDTTDFLDYYLSLQTTCHALVSAQTEFPVIGGGGTRRFVFADCTRLHKVFASVGVVDACAMEFPEACDDIDNNCDGYTDNAPNTATDNTLTAACWPGAVGQRGVGACTDGLSTCNDGVWSACGGSLKLPEAEICDQIDNDCDQSTDEGAQVELGLDEDGDTYAGPSAHRWDCPLDNTQEPLPHWVPVVGRSMDCDDTNPDINPGAVELCGGARLDENCDGAFDEDCPCSTNGGGILCGPLSDDCKGLTEAEARLLGGQAYPNSCKASTSEFCSFGVQTCDGGSYSGHCSGVQYGSVEVCDGEDNDCDGLIDNMPNGIRWWNAATNSWAGVGVPCGYNDSGTMSCRNANVFCDGADPWETCGIASVSPGQKGKWLPPLSAGDNEWAASCGSSDVSFSTGVYTRVGGVNFDRIEYEIFFQATEVGGDGTAVDATSTPFTLTQAPDGCRIDRYRVDGTSRWFNAGAPRVSWGRFATDCGGVSPCYCEGETFCNDLSDSRETCNIPEGIVSQLLVDGDHTGGGGDVGIFTGVIPSFRPITYTYCCPL